MKHVKSNMYTVLILAFLIMMFTGTLYGASVTMQPEGALQKDRESATVNSDVTRDGNQLTLTPQRRKDKNDSVVESGPGRQSLKMERYKPYQAGVGERKIK